MAQTYTSATSDPATFFPLTGGVVNPDIWGDGTYDETTKTLVTGQYGFGGWQYSTNPIDLSKYKYLVVKMASATELGQGTDFRLFDNEGYFSDCAIYDITNKSSRVIPLSSVYGNNAHKALDVSKIYIAGLWSYGNFNIYLDTVFVSNDGIVPAEENESFTDVDYPFYFNSQWFNDPKSMMDGQQPFAKYVSSDVDNGATWFYLFNTYDNELTDDTLNCTLSNYAGLHIELPSALENSMTVQLGLAANNLTNTDTATVSFEIPAGETTYDYKFSDSTNVKTTDYITFIKLYLNDNRGITKFNKLYLTDAEGNYAKGYLRNSGWITRTVYGTFVTDVNHHIISDNMDLSNSGLSDVEYTHYTKAKVYFGSQTSAALTFNFGVWGPQSSDNVPAYNTAAVTDSIGTDMGRLWLYLNTADSTTTVNVKGAYLTKRGYKRTSLTKGRYYTVCLPNAATANDDVTLYTVSSADNSKIYLSETGSQSMEAGVPYLYTTSSDSALFVMNAGDAAEATSNGALVGVLDATAVSQDSNDKIYVLSNNKLYKVSGTPTLHANRAYFDLSKVTSSAKAGAVSLDIVGGNATGIKSIETDSEETDNAPYYNLQGQRVLNPQHGVFIHGNKKVIIK